MALTFGFMKKATVFVSVGLFLSVFALTALAQEKGTAAEPGKWRKKPALTFKLGGFFPSLSMSFRVDATLPSGLIEEGTEIDVEDEFGLDKNVTTLRGDGDIRVAPWFSVALGYYGHSRSNTSVIDEDIQIGDTVFPINQTVETSLITSFYNVDFKFYIFHRPRLDFGVYAGLYLGHFRLRVEAQEIDRQLLEIKKIWAPVPSLGLHFQYTLIPNLYLYAKAGYFYLKPRERITFNSATVQINLDYYFYNFLGIGAMYEYDRFDLDVDAASFHGKLKYGMNGAHMYVVVGF